MVAAVLAFMIFEQLNEGACKTYLIASEKTGEALLVDPVLEGVDRYVAEVERRGLRLRCVVDTQCTPTTSRVVLLAAEDAR